MKLLDALAGAKQLFLDSAPIIYLVEQHPVYEPRLNPLFHQLTRGTLKATVSPISLAECLVGAYKYQNTKLIQTYRKVLLRGKGVTFIPIHETVADDAARFRTLYNLALPDAFQLATALSGSCDLFVTNDVIFKRVTEIKVLVVDEYE